MTLRSKINKLKNRGNGRRSTATTQQQSQTNVTNDIESTGSDVIVDSSNVWTTVKSGQLPTYEMAILQKTDENPPDYSEYQKQVESNRNSNSENE